MSELVDLNDAAAYDYALPQELVAQAPIEPRDAARLLAVGPNDTLRDLVFHDFPRLLQPGDLLVLNETRVIPARIVFRRESGGKGELLLLRPADRPAFDLAAREWYALVRPARRLNVGARIQFHCGSAMIVEGGADGMRRLRFDPGLDLETLLAQEGEVPLPPYIGASESDQRERYQTIFARVPGSVAAPTASLHFTDAVFAGLAERGVSLARLTLDVGIGTFRPMREGPITEHHMHSERYAISVETSEAIALAKAEGRRIVAAGTTVVRALEGVAQHDGRVHPGAGETDLFIRPGFQFAVVDALLTNFHLPRSTLLSLVSAFAGYERIRAAYRHAIAAKYRFFSFGDAMFVERMEP